jgi:hypothetical protein
MRRGVCTAALLAFAFPAAAQAHIERPSYWPDPEPDTAVTPAAGGHAPKARTLASALDDKKPGKTRVVCQDDSLERANKAISRARKHGYDIRPSDHRTLSKSRAKKLRRINRALAKRCTYDEINDAALDARNNDRIVVMPGIYTEPTARKQPTHDKKCEKYLRNTEFGDPGALSYAYHLHCPNDQNLIAIMGRAQGKDEGKGPDPPPVNRHGIPNVGRCIRCNVQLEGSGVSADDVIVDAGKVSLGNSAPNGENGAKKDVGVRADRADGFVLRNILVRHAGEHGIYVMETDGYLLDRFKVFYNGIYGTLTFVEDHGVQQNCEGVGHPDSAIYPGAAVESGVQRPLGWKFRYNQEVRRCDLHHNLAGYSGTDGNAVHVHHNNIYGNTLGWQSDVVTAAGHPGFPSDSDLVENNNFYSNNFNPYTDKSDVKAKFPFPQGTGLWIAGGNHHVVRRNHFWNNWRRGTMVFAVPDALVCGPDGQNTEQAGCDYRRVSTSNYNRHYENTMGKSPSGGLAPNGVDFWWDDFGGNKGNCWFRNFDPKGMTFSPRKLPNCDNGKDPSLSFGQGSPTNEGELISCVAAFETRDFDPETSTCPWLRPVSKPSQARKASAGERRRLAEVYREFCAENPTSGTCEPSLAGKLELPRAFSYKRVVVKRPELPKTFNMMMYDCSDWRKASPKVQHYVIWRLRTLTSGPVTGTGVSGRGTVIPDDHAERLFGGYCREDYAQGFLLYKLYAAASVFVGGTP